MVRVACLQHEHFFIIMPVFFEIPQQVLCYQLLCKRKYGKWVGQLDALIVYKDIQVVFGKL
jgi:hypothetical protein